MSVYMYINACISMRIGQKNNFRSILTVFISEQFDTERLSNVSGDEENLVGRNFTDDGEM